MELVYFFVLENYKPFVPTELVNEMISFSITIETNSDRSKLFVKKNHRKKIVP